MASKKPNTKDSFQPTDKVKWSGIYDVVHGKGCKHGEHQVTCVTNEEFPPCATTCGSGVRFRLYEAAKHLGEYKRFKKKA